MGDIYILWSSARSWWWRMLMFWSYNWLIPYFGGRFFPISGQAEKASFATTVRSLFNENILNQFYIHLCAQIFDFFWLVKILLMYTLIHTFKKYLPANNGRFKQLNCQWWPFTTFRFQINYSCPTLKILCISKISCDWFPPLTTYYIYSHT